MSYLVDTPGRLVSHFLKRETEEAWIWGRGEVWEGLGAVGAGKCTVWIQYITEY